MSSWRLLTPWLCALQRQPWRTALGFGLMLATALFGIGLLGLSGWFITATAVFVVAFDIFMPGAGIRAFAILRTVARYAERLANHDAILRVQQQWRVNLFAGLTRQPTSTLEKVRVAHTLQRLTQDLQALDDLYIRVLAPFVMSALLTLLLGAGLYLLAPQLAWLVWALGAVLLSVHASVLAPRLRQRAATELAYSEALRQQALDLMQSKAELLAWQVFTQASAQVAASADQLDKHQAQLRQRLWRLQHIVELLGMLGVVAVFAMALTFALQGSFSLPLAVLAGLAMLAMIENWTLLPQVSLLWGRVTGAAERLQPLLIASQQPTSLPALKRAGAPALKLVDVVPAGRQLPPVSATIEAGCLHWLQAKSGAGKSSLLWCLSGQLPLAQGRIEVTQQQQTQPLQQVAVSFLTQHNAVISQTIAANLRMGDPKATDDALWAVLEQVELADDVEALAEQLDTWVGDGGVGLSGGQARRLMLARVLLHAANSDLILLDEPFNGVGDAQARRIWARVLPVLQAKTTIVASHTALPTEALPRRIQL
ncbi:amino acid ABC transporter ATP-binding/permease protein [Aliidiomarina maris]|uniref:ATP-binding cassette subfamily C protein CydC n=1 Tax=Aliidiomarina maris TaxID=531312 RepID=A0A327WYP1_9GAMM|nr:ATP-binding cassette domain-containing protein [Aliidiomarina maris]RAJ98309.1 ATP-binding cassette subfamily C protein CydC [Aliidiomarina maris]RUO24866.1 hypothetical protein CWE07_07430 [Aliidiomarina maris]